MVTVGTNWIENSDVLSIFPTFVWTIHSTAEFHQPLNGRILGALHEMNPQLSAISPGESWQSEQNLHAREEFTELVASVHSAAQIVLQFLHIGYEALELTGCWANVNSSGVAHAMHSHPNNFLSGVYYVRTQPGADTVNFHDPRPQTGVIRPPVTALTAENTDQVVVNVSNGTLLMFPAYLAHSVSRNDSEDLRISVSFNLMFSQFTENLSQPMWSAD
jgi:uncharacterized protein (TIGR02466 family)